MKKNLVRELDLLEWKNLSREKGDRVDRIGYRLKALSNKCYVGVHEIPARNTLLEYSFLHNRNII